MKQLIITHDKDENGCSPAHEFSLGHIQQYTVVDNPYRSFSAGCFSACGTACSLQITSDGCKAFRFVPDQTSASSDAVRSGRTVKLILSQMS